MEFKTDFWTFSPYDWSERKGGYPLRFLEKLQEKVGQFEGRRVLHTFSGHVPKSGETEVAVDIDKGVAPDIQGDARQLPFADDTFDVVVSDPPYSKEMSKYLYDQDDYPRPYHHLREEIRVCAPGGHVAVLDFLLYDSSPRHLGKTYPVDREWVIAVYPGANFRIRALTIFRKNHTLKDWGWK